MHTSRFAAAAAIALTALALAGAYDAAEARTRRAQGAVTTQRGTVTGQSNTQRQRGSRTRDTIVTGPNGGQRSVHDERTRNRQDGVYTHDRTTTFGDGTTRTVDTDALRTGQGQYLVSREVTRRNGETRVQTGDFAVEQTGNGRTITGDINTSNHGQIDYTRSVARDQGVRTVNSSATFEDGTSITRASSGTCANGVCASAGSITGRDGGVTTWEQTRARTENGATLSRDVTFDDGTTRAIDRERVGNGDGTGTISRTVTGRDGETRTQEGEYEITRTP